MSCDLCGKRTTGLIDLVENLRGPSMAVVCGDCEGRLNRRLNQLRSRATSAAWRKLRMEMKTIRRPWWKLWVIR